MNRVLSYLLTLTLSLLIAYLVYPTLTSKTSQPPRDNYTMVSTRDKLGVIATRNEWLPILQDLPTKEELGRKIPSFFIAHGHPTLLWPKDLPNGRADMFGSISGPGGLLSQFLEDLGPILMEKYKPKAVVVFSAHWETDGEAVVTDYGDENPLLYDYYNFPRELYQLQWKSHGSSTISSQVVETLRKHGLSARTTTRMESRGRDGRTGKDRPLVHAGFDHGVFVPFKLMFPDGNDVQGQGFGTPVVQVSMSDTYKPEDEWKLGQAVQELRSQDILVLSGGLTIHTFQDWDSFNEEKAKEAYHVWNDKIIKAVQTQGSVHQRKAALFSLTKEPEFRLAHPQEDHFVPLYIAAGAGSDGNARLLSGMYGCTSVAFGL